MTDILLARAAIAAAAASPHASESTTPEHPGVVSFIDTIPDEEDAIFSVLGDSLDSVDSEVEWKERMSQFPIALGTLASEASISNTTGCWSLDAEWKDYKGKSVWRDDKGYSYAWHPEHFGYRIDGNEGFKGVAVHRMAYNMKLRAQGLPDLVTKQHVDHKCRWPGCCNINHMTVVDRGQNNRLRDEAKVLENAIMAGQTILGPYGLGWLDERILSSTTEFTSIVITTPIGPHRIVMIEKDPLIFAAKKLDCDLLEAVIPPAPKNYDRRSRAKKHKPVIGEMPMFEIEPSPKPKLKKLYAEAMKA